MDRVAEGARVKNLYLRGLITGIFLGPLIAVLLLSLRTDINVALGVVLLILVAISWFARPFMRR